jgi:hypothetical protein
MKDIVPTSLVHLRALCLCTVASLALFRLDSRTVTSVRNKFGESWNRQNRLISPRHVEGIHPHQRRMQAGGEIGRKTLMAAPPSQPAKH